MQRLEDSVWRRKLHETTPNDDADDNEGRDWDKGPTYQEASKTVEVQPSTRTKEIGSS
jgi:hypothetical protein